MKKFLLIFCLLLTTTFLFAENINWQNVLTDKNPRSKKNTELVNKIVQNIEYYKKDINSGNFSFTEVIKMIMNNNITSILNGKIEDKQSNSVTIVKEFLFGYKYHGNYNAAKITDISKQIPLRIFYFYVDFGNYVVVTYNIAIYGKLLCIGKINTDQEPMWM